MKRNQTDVLTDDVAVYNNTILQGVTLVDAQYVRIFNSCIFHIVSGYILENFITLKCTGI